MPSTQRSHHANECECGLQADIFEAHRALCSLRSKKELTAETQLETHVINNEGQHKWIEDYTERETAAARKQVEDAEAAVLQVQEVMTCVEIAGLMSRKHERRLRRCWLLSVTV